MNLYTPFCLVSRGLLGTAAQQLTLPVQMLFVVLMSSLPDWAPVSLLSDPRQFFPLFPRFRPWCSSAHHLRPSPFCPHPFHSGPLQFAYAWRLLDCSHHRERRQLALLSLAVCKRQIEVHFNNSFFLLFDTKNASATEFF